MNDQQPHMQSTAIHPYNGVETILLVDDEPIIRKLVRIILTRYGYQVIVAENGVAAVEIYAKQMERIDLVILDGIMPKQSGRDTLIQLCELNPDIRVLFSSGYSAEQNQIQDIEQVVGFIHKPYKEAHLAEKIRACLDRTAKE